MLSFSISSTEANLLFEVVSSSGQIRLKSDAALDYDAGTREYTFSAVVMDDGTPALQDTATVKVAISNINEAPVFDGGDEVVQYAENSTSVVQSYSASDPEGDTILWGVGGTDGELFGISGGTLRFVKAPDFETPEDAETDNGYMILVTAEDSEGVETDFSVTVQVTNVNEAPTFPQDDYQLYAMENLTGDSSIGAALQATDVDEGDTAKLTYLLQPSGKFTIDDDGQVRLAAGETLDFEFIDGYSLTASATDPGGLRSDVGVTIVIQDVNEPPGFSERAPSRTINEETPGASVQNAVLASDEDAGSSLTYSVMSTIFDVDGGGIISLPGEEVLSYEDEDEYLVSLSVSDGLDEDGNVDTSADDTVQVTIKVNNLEEAGVVMIDDLNPDIGDEVLATLTDPDGSVTAQNWKWQRGKQPDWALGGHQRRDGG